MTIKGKRKKEILEIANAIGSDVVLGLYKKNLVLKSNNEITAVSYSNELKPEILEIHKRYKVSSHQKMKSSLKFCVVATGEFDGYVAEPRACEWDIAAGHAILKHSGGLVSDFDNNEILYGKKDFKNPSLILKSKKLVNG